MKYLLALLVAVLLMPLAQGATSTTIFSGVTVGPTVNLRPNQFIQAGTYQVTGTGVATLEWQYSSDQANWATLASYTAAAGPITFANPGFYRFSCTGFTSGTLTGVIVTPYFVYQQTTGPSGAVVFQVDDGGVTSSLFTGPTSGGGSSIFAGLTITGTTANSVTNAGGYTSTHATGVAPFTATSTTVCPNLNASLLNGATFAAPGTIGGTTPAAATFTTVTGNTSVTSASIASTGTGAASVTTPGGYTSTVASGTAPITVTSTDLCPNLHAANADALGGATFAAPGPIGGGTPSTSAFTTLTTSGFASFGSASLTRALLVNHATLPIIELQRGGTSVGFFSNGSSSFGAGGLLDIGIDANATANFVLIGSGGTSGMNIKAGLANAVGTTDSSSVTTGSLITGGGLGVVKRSFLGTIGSTFSGNVNAGVQDGTAASAGQVGEVLSASQTSYTNFTTTATYQQLVTVSMTPGDWMEYATVTFDGNGATDVGLTNSIATLCDTTASATGAVEGETLVYAVNQITSTLKTTVSFTFHENISAAKSKYLNGQMTFTAGNCRYVCSLKCVRIR